MGSDHTDALEERSLSQHQHKQELFNLEPPTSPFLLLLENTHTLKCPSAFKPYCKYERPGDLGERETEQ